MLKSLDPSGEIESSVLANYLVHAAHENPYNSCTLVSQWDHLPVVATVNTTLLFEALDMACTAQTYGNPNDSQPIRPHMLGASWQLLRLAFSLSLKSTDARDRPAWVIVKAFLWTHWQRMLMLTLWYRLDMQIYFGYDYDSGNDIEGLGSIPDLHTYQIQVHLRELKMAPYMCSWAYELLRNDRASATNDLRHFHSCYNKLFSGRPARCKVSQQQCKGGPQNCQRFKGAVISDQSAHDTRCSGKCRRLVWIGDLSWVYGERKLFVLLNRMNITFDTARPPNGPSQFRTCGVMGKEGGRR